MTQPFDEKDVLYRFTPSETRHGYPDECVLAGNPYLIWGRFGETWENVSSWQWSVVVAHLLRERAKLTDLVERRSTDVYGLLQQIALVEAERDRHKEALEHYARKESWAENEEGELRFWDNESQGPDVAREALGRIHK
jgi:hypothetical protein